MIDFKRGVVFGTIDHEHSEMLRAWRNDPRIWNWCRQNDLITQSDQIDWMVNHSRDKAIRMYLIKAKEQPIGVCGLTSIDQWNHRAEFSLYIAPEFQAKRYGKKALATLLDHAFDHLGLHLVWGETFALNPAQKMFLSLGFECEGTRREFYFRNGNYTDAVLYSITDEEWKRWRSSKAISLE